MKRWKSTVGHEVENEKIDAFLTEVIEVCKKHGLSIGHEDSHGGFLVHKFSKDNADWLMNADDETDSA
ncbi:MAG: hypothetical protein Q8L37_06185 [Candidatus Gottesmanbacteria bacterium]|nr:hypothetical protein [Candidatus Gottesmanbacteria bacterium]